MVKTNAFDLLLYVLLLMMSSVSDAQLDVVQQPMNTTVCAGSTATFTCVIFFQTGVPVNPRWFRNDDSIVNSTRYTIISNFTDSLRNPVHIGSTITVSNITTADDGTQYRCSAVILSNNATLNVTDPPNTDLQIIVNEICVNDFSASWTPVSNEEGLSYNVTLSGPGLMNENVINSTMNIFHNFTRLSPNTTYTISVVSELDSCPGIPSTEMVTTLTESEGVPQRVLNFRRTKRTNTTITVEWDDAENPTCVPVLYYHVTIVNSTAMINSTTMTIPGTAERMVKFSNLMSNTSYTISVTAENRVGRGQAFTIIVTTLTDEEEAISRATNDESGGGGLSGGAIGGIICAVVITLVVLITVVIGVIVYQKKHSKIDNGEKLAPKKQKSPTAPTTEYAELALGASGAAPPADPTKVSYTEVKEHEQLGYVQVQHEPGTSDKPIRGAPQVEYKELLHQ